MNLHPPQRLARFVDRVLPTGPRGDVMRGDLREEFAQRVRRGSRLAATAWLIVHTISIMVWLQIDRARRGSNHASSGGDRREALRTAVRSLRRAPGYATAVILTLGLGLAIVVTVFAVERGILLRPLPFPESDRLVRIDRVRADGSLANGSVAYPDLDDWRSNIKALDGIAGYSNTELIYSVDGVAEIWKGQSATANFLSVLRVQPHLGLRPEGFAADTAFGARRILLGYHLWQRRFGGTQDVIGRTLHLGDEDWTVDGILPPEFGYPIPGIDFVIPLPESRFWSNRTAGTLRTVARLSESTSLEMARQEVDRVVAAIDAESDAWHHGVAVRGIQAAMVEPVERTLLVFQGAVLLVLLVACANVAALTLARTRRRRRELALRAALGASHRRLVQELLSEVLVLSVVGGVFGLGAAWGGLQTILALMPADMPRTEAVSIDPWVVAFSALVAVGVGVLSGAVPAWRGSRMAFRDAVGTERSVVGAGRRGQEVLAGAQMAVAVVLLFGAGLLTRSFMTLTAVDPGFRTTNTTVVEVGLDSAKYQSREAVLAFHASLMKSVGAMDDVESVGLSTLLPFSPSQLSASVVTEGELFQRDRVRSVNLEFVNGDYVEAMGLPMVQGVALDTSAAPEPKQVLVNEAAARLLWPNQNAMGQLVSFDVEDGQPAAAGSYFRVVGVVGDSLNQSLDQADVPIAYYSLPDVSRYYSFSSGRFFYLAVHTAGPPSPTLPAGIQQALGAIDPTVPPRTITTMDELVATTTRTARFVAVVVLVFAGLGAGVALLGLHGVMAYGVSQTLGEMALRMALGATPGSVRGRVLARAMRVVVVAGSIGAVGAMSMATVLGTYLFQVPPRDPVTLGAVLAITLLGGLAAAYVPAAIASRVDPMEVLKDR